ncbi:hypothetical protein [Burkholderia multivorans]|nr:hypothetical protein [Burkholderia multivorans]
MQKDPVALHPAHAAAMAVGAPAGTRRGAIAAAVIGNWLGGVNNQVQHP